MSALREWRCFLIDGPDRDRGKALVVYDTKPPGELMIGPDSYWHVWADEVVGEYAESSKYRLLYYTDTEAHYAFTER